MPYIYEIVTERFTYLQVAFRVFNFSKKNFQTYSFTHTHTYVYQCVCVRVCLMDKMKQEMELYGGKYTVV